jgi:putative restriction endonuclease
VFHHLELKNFTYLGERVPLKDGQRGIWNPSDFESTLSITTSLNDPYADELSDDMSLKYSYQKRDGGDNIKLRRAYETRTPLIYFRAVRKGEYVAYSPAYVVGADDSSRQFSVAFDETVGLIASSAEFTENQRRYAERVVRQRLHQPVFRARVMEAYASLCAVCQLGNPQLLDAAHIIADSDSNGFAEVSNGLALCKLHHAAYDRNLLGITPKYEVRVSPKVLLEKGSPMLRHGLQDMHGRQLQLPGRSKHRPSTAALETRFAEFSA